MTFDDGDASFKDQMRRALSQPETKKRPEDKPNTLESNTAPCHSLNEFQNNRNKNAR